MTSPEPTPVHDEAAGYAERHAAALTLQQPVRVDLAADLARPHPARLRQLLEGLGDASAPVPNRVAWWALDALFPGPGASGPLDPERLHADTATLGSELTTVAAVLSGWLLCGAASQGLLPSGAVAASVAEQAQERARLATLAQRLRELAEILGEQVAGGLLAPLPDDVLEAAFSGDDARGELAPPVTTVVGPALNGHGEPTALEPPADGRSAIAALTDQATDPEAETEVIEPADETQELG